MAIGITIGGVLAGIAVDQALTKGAEYARDDGELRQKFEEKQYGQVVDELNKSEVEVLMDGVRKYVRDQNGQIGREEKKQLNQLENELRANGEPQ